MKALLPTHRALIPVWLMISLATRAPLAAAPPSGENGAHGWPRASSISMPARFELGNGRWAKFIPPFKAAKACVKARVASVDRSGTFPKVTFAPEAITNWEDFNGKLSIGRPADENNTLDGNRPFEPLTAAEMARIQLTLEWKDMTRPVPLVPQQSIYLGIDAQDRVSCFLTYLDDTAAFAAIRRASDGDVEVIVALSAESEDGGQKQPTFLHVKPNFTDLDVGYMFGLLWTEKSGLVLTSLSHVGGDEAVAMESLPSIQKRGIPIANVPDMRVVVGEEGWHLLDDIPGGSKGGHAYIIPERQFMTKWDLR